MIYKFVTREEFEALREKYVSDDLRSAYEDMIERLLSERDAYREVAMKEHQQQSDNTTGSIGPFIDAEAAKIIRQKAGLAIERE